MRKTDKMKAISRRQFLQMAGASAVAVAAISIPGISKGEEGQGEIKVRSLPPGARGRKISFCQTATFPSAPDAFRVLASRGIEAEIYIDL